MSIIAAGAKTRYASKFTGSFTKNNARAWPQTNSAQPQQSGVMNNPWARTALPISRLNNWSVCDHEEVLSPGVPLLVIEAGGTLGWNSYVGPQIAVIGVETFGASAPGTVVMQHYGFTREHVCELARKLLQGLKEQP